MKKIKIITFTASLMCLCSCSCSCTSSDKNSGISLVKTEDNYYKNDKYIVGKRIFDNNYFCDNAPTLPEERTFTLEEFPGLTFNNYQSSASFEDESGTYLGMSWALYIADVNQDDHFDLCFVKSVGSGVITYEAYIYDVFNHQYLLEKADRNKYNYFFELDENNVLCLIEGRSARGSYQRVHRVGRFLKDTKESMFDWYTYDDLKVTGIYNYNPNSYQVETVTGDLNVGLYAYIDIDYEPIFTVDELIIEKVSGPDFAYQIAELDVSQARYGIKITYSNSGVSKIKFKFRDVSVVEEIVVREKEYAE